jgi:hypothetical protein
MRTVVDVWDLPKAVYSGECVGMERDFYETKLARIAALESALRKIAASDTFDAMAIRQYASEALATTETFAKRPIDYQHEQAHITCPDCGINLRTSAPKTKGEQSG